MPKLYQLNPRTEITYEDLDSWLIVKLCQFQANYPDCEIYEVEEQWPGFYLHCYPAPSFDQVSRFVTKSESFGTVRGFPSMREIEEEERGSADLYPLRQFEEA